MRSARPIGVLRLLGRGALLRCPNCGGGDLFTRWVTMADHCPTCGHRFERMEGYWLGAIMVNTAVSFGAFLLGLGGALALTWPDVPWTALTIGLMAAVAIVPIAFYPFSKTLWVAMELAARPLEAGEPGRSDGRGRRASGVINGDPGRRR